MERRGWFTLVFSMGMSLLIRCWRGRIGLCDEVVGRGCGFELDFWSSLV